VKAKWSINLRRAVESITIRLLPVMTIENYKNGKLEGLGLFYPSYVAEEINYKII
jgi:hypothetical protein